MLFALPWALAAHDIPNDVTAQLFVKPEGQHLNVLVRVPLRSIRDVVFPQRGNGYLDLDRTAAMLPGLSTLWLSDFIELYEDARPLPRPAAPSVRSNSRETPGWCGSTRGGSRQPYDLSSWASSTFWKARTTCCFCFAWVIPFRRLRALIPVVTAFTAATR